MREACGGTVSPHEIRAEITCRHSTLCKALALALLAVTGLTLLSSIAGCARLSGDRGDIVTTPAGWRPVRLGDIVTFAVPPDARDQDVQPIDSIFGVILDDGYEVIYDYGRSGEQLSAHEDQPGYTRHSRSVDERAGVQVSFQTDGKPRGVVRILQVQDGPNVLTIWVSCTDEDTCRLANDLFDSVRFTSA